MTIKVSNAEPEMVPVIDGLMYQPCSGHILRVRFEDGQELDACERHIPVVMHLTRLSGEREGGASDEGDCRIHYDPPETVN